MTYAGNPNLPPEVQKRILDTFRHTLDVAARGGLEEARLGCDFVLQLDSQFGLARTLSERLRGAGGPVAVDDLRARLDGGGGPAAAPKPATAPAAKPAVAPDELRRELGRLFLSRDFPSLMGRAKQEQAAVAADPKLQALLAQAQALMEAEPYVDRFLQKARGARAIGRLEDVSALVEKARALDPEHPALAEFAAAAAPAPPPRVAPPSPPPMEELDPPMAPNVFAAAPPGADEMSFGDLDTHELRSSLPVDDPSMALPADDELPMDLPPFEMPAIESLEDEPAAAAAMPEELSLEGLSLDEPAAAPVAAGRGGGPSDPDPRVAELLDEGQAQFERGELQSAIDAWSRIFLIDIDHHEAARRIDQARNAKAEQERQIEEAYHDALGQIQAKDFEAAKATLERVLSMAPNHVTARDTLAKLERGEVTSLPTAVPAAPTGGLLDELSAADDEQLKEEILVPPEPGERKRLVTGEKAAPPKSKRPLALAAAAALVVLLGGGWYVLTHRSSLFPNTDAQPTKQAVEQTPITRAKELYKQGRRMVAISQLKRVPPASPYFDEAQALIAQWQAEETATSAPAGATAEQLAQREALMTQAKQAEAERHFMAVGPLLTQAAAITPLSDDEKAMAARAKQAVAPLEATLTLLRAEEYDRSLRDLWVVLEKDQGNTDARIMLTAAYYNKGVLSLQQGNAKEAEDNLKEAAGLTPTDDDVQRLLRFAQTYESRDQDLLYRIFTKYLTARAL